MKFPLKIKQLFVAQIKALVEHRYYRMVEPYLIAGPTLIGWLLAFYRYEKDQPLFKAGFYHASVFVAYIAVFIFVQIIGWVNPFQFQDYISYVQSALAALYLFATISFLVKFLKAQKNQKTFGYPPKLQILIDRLSI